MTTPRTASTSDARKRLAENAAAPEPTTEAAALLRAADIVEAKGDEYYGFFSPLPPEFDYAALDHWLLGMFGFRIDRISADMFRRAYAGAARVLRDAAQDVTP